MKERVQETAPRAGRSSWWAHVALLPLAVLWALPLVWMAVGSLKTNADFLVSLGLPRDEQGSIAPSRLTVSHFVRLFTELNFGRHLANSVLLAGSTAVLATLIAAAGGYALAQFGFRGRRALEAMLLIVLIIPGPLLLAPSYDLLFSLGLLDRYWGLILPALAPAFGVILFRGATISAVPRELVEAARLDGLGEVRIFWLVALPLLRPVLSAFVLITFLGTWNNFIGPQIVLQTASKFPLSVAVGQLQGLYHQEYGLLMASTVISIAPVMILFLLLQRDFVAGLTAGAVKQ